LRRDVTEEPERLGLSPERLQQLAVSIDKKVRKGKYYLDPDIDILSLSRKLGTNRSYLSQAISFGLDCNFCAYMNQLRIEEIIGYGAPVLKSEDSLYDTALVCGFNNRRTFYRAFFREMGMMPIDFVARYKQLSLHNKNQQD